MPTFENTRRIIVEVLDVQEAEVLPETSLANDLGADSLDFIALLQAFEAEFNIQIPDADVSKLETVADVIKYIESKI
ncbi:MAG: acyl carrier protein [Candidatus Cloacimonadota bacterium]|nr:MAG: acyl carrier protein [Candidatus Cloacimonadota bacterium]